MQYLKGGELCRGETMRLEGSGEHALDVRCRGEEGADGSRRDVRRLGKGSVISHSA